MNEYKVLPSVDCSVIICSGGIYPRLEGADGEGRCKTISQSTIIIACNPGNKNVEV